MRLRPPSTGAGHESATRVPPQAGRRTWRPCRPRTRGARAAETRAAARGRTSFVRPGEQTLRARLDHDSLEAPRLRSGDTLAQRRQPEIPPPFVIVLLRWPRRALANQRVRQHRSQRPVEVARHDPREFLALLNRAHERPPMKLALHAREKNLEDTQIQRQEDFDVIGSRLYTDQTVLDSAS